MDDNVTVTHFSLDSWGQIEQKTTQLNPKVSNQSQNPFNPFTSDASNEVVASAPENAEEGTKVEEEKKANTNPFIDSNPFLGLLNPFKEVQPVVEKKVEAETEKNGARVVKTEEIQTTTTTLTHKVRLRLLLNACKLLIVIQFSVLRFCNSKENASLNFRELCL